MKTFTIAILILWSQIANVIFAHDVVTFDDNRITITIQPPSTGMYELGRTQWDDPAIKNAEKEIFKKINRKRSSVDYSVYVVYWTENRYGEKEYTSPCYIGSLSSNDVRRYVDYDHFKGTVSNMVKNPQGKTPLESSAFTTNKQQSDEPSSLKQGIISVWKVVDILFWVSIIAAGMYCVFSIAKAAPVKFTIVILIIGVYLGALLWMIRSPFSDDHPVLFCLILIALMVSWTFGLTWLIRYWIKQSEKKERDAIREKYLRLRENYKESFPVFCMNENIDPNTDDKYEQLKILKSSMAFGNDQLEYLDNMMKKTERYRSLYPHAFEYVCNKKRIDPRCLTFKDYVDLSSLSEFELERLERKSQYFKS